MSFSRYIPLQWEGGGEGRVVKPQEWLYIPTLNFSEEKIHGQLIPFVCYQAPSPLVHFRDLLMEIVFPA